MNKQSLCLHCLQKLLSTQQIFCCLGCKSAYRIIKKNGFENFYQFRQSFESKNPQEFNSKNSEISQQNQTNLGNRPSNTEEFNLDDFAKLKNASSKNDDPKNNRFELAVMISGLHCAACVWLIESLLKKQPKVESARINLSQKTLNLSWQGDLLEGRRLLNLVSAIGYKILPFDLAKLSAQSAKEESRLIKALAVAGFGAGNVMLFSFSLWFSSKVEMGGATRQFLHLFSSLLALPVLIYSGRIFFISAFKSIKARLPNMDLAISIAIFLASSVSLLESFRGGEHVYFDSAVMLVFFLLIGRFLDFKTRKKAFEISSEFALLSASFGRVEQNGKIAVLPAEKLLPEMILLVAVGEKIAADGKVIEGQSSIDNSLLTGESIPKKIMAGDRIFAGSINISSPIKVEITSTYQQSFLFQASKIIASAEEKKSRYVQIANRWSKIYIPTVHILALLTFLLWFLRLNSGFETALMNATAVLVITCPCALALAVPIVQTIAIAAMIKRGIVVKNGEIFEKLPKVKTIIFDKTGSLTVGSPQLTKVAALTDSGLEFLNDQKKELAILLAAKLAARSNHPLSLAIFKASQEIQNKEQQNNQKFDKNGPIANQYYQNHGCLISLHLIDQNHEKSFDLQQSQNGWRFLRNEVFEIEEKAGFGIKGKIAKKEVVLGRANFCGIDQKLLTAFNRLNQENAEASSHCFLSFDQKILVFFFKDCLKEDAFSVVESLKNAKKRVIMLSGDNKNTVETTASYLGINEFYGEVDLASKAQFIKQLKSTIPKNEMLMMVGDGLNDAPSLAICDVSISFSKACDLTQNVADIVISSQKLNPILEAVDLAKFNLGLMRQNLWISLLYNLIAVPFAMSGKVVPLVAALAMSGSSLTVLFNGLRARKSKLVLNRKFLKN